MSTTYFKNKTLPILLVLPQLIITLIFFIWPALQALWQSVFISDPFGLHHHFVFLHNFLELFSSSTYLYSFWITFVFSACVTVLTLAFGLLFAYLVNQVVRG